MRTVVGGFGFDPVDSAAAVTTVLERLERGAGGRVVTPNVDILRQASADEDAAQLIASADLVLADGMPVVWAARLAGSAIPGRVPGSMLGPLLAASAAKRSCGLFLLGGDEGTAERAAVALRVLYPELRVGWHFPPFGFEHDDAEQRAIEVALDAFGPCVCLVGLGFPKQDRLGARLLLRFPQSWFVGAGATIAFMAGDVPRAPQWVQQAGLEWVHRLMQEPSRLAGRYLRDIPFTIRLLGTSLKSRWQLESETV